MKMLGYDAAQDYANRCNSDVHYRLYWSTRKQALVVICVQDFDYFDYDDNCFVDYVAYATEDDADRALALTLNVIGAVVGNAMPGATRWGSYPNPNAPAHVDTSGWDDRDNG